MIHTNPKPLKLTTFVLQTLFISIMAILAMNWASRLFASLTHLGPIDWGLTGRWLMMVLHGQFFTPNIALLPPIKHEWLLGFAFHDILSFIFALTYLLLLKHCFKRQPSTLNGIFFGLSLSVFSLGFEQPSMGYGILGLAKPQPIISLIHTLIFHTSFGFGLGLGGNISDWWLNRKKSV